MTPRIALLVCEHYQRELAAVLASETFPEAVMSAFPARCNRPPLTEEELQESLAPLGEVERVEVFGAACCLARIDMPPDGTSPLRCHGLDQCFETIADGEQIARCLRDGAYLVTPGWLSDWPAALKRLGLDRQMARALFGETTTRVVLLDTGIDPSGSLRDLEAFAGFIDRPFAVVPVGLSYLRLLVTRTILLWRLEREQQSCSRTLQEIRKQSADYALAVDLMGGIGRITEEGEAVEAMLDFFTMLFAPGHLAYLSFRNDRPARLWLRPPAADPAEAEAIRNRLAAFAGESGRTASGTGIVLKILYREQTQGVIEAESIAFPEYRDHYLNLALNIVRVCALPIENARKYEQLRQTEALLQQANEELFRLATTDALTGIANRRSFDDHLEREWRRMVREQSPLSLLMADIDFFKNYNDRYGHQAGDACLHAVAEAIRSRACRPGDFIARYGGEEFVVILPGTPAAGALYIAEEIRRAVRALEIPHADSRVDAFVTLSLGVAQTVPAAGRTPEALLREADRALYAAKNQGRNRVVLGGAPPIPAGG